MKFSVSLVTELNISFNPISFPILFRDALVLEGSGVGGGSLYFLSCVSVISMLVSEAPVFVHLFLVSLFRTQLSVAAKLSTVPYISGL